MAWIADRQRYRLVLSPELLHRRYLRTGTALNATECLGVLLGLLT